MLLERQKILTNDMIEQRQRKFGKTIGTWICNNEDCKNLKKSFLFSWELHIPSVCDVCDIGDMIEDESKRERQQSPAMSRGKAGEDEWFSKQDILTQTGTLLGDDPKY